MNLKGDFIVREIGGESFLVPIGEAAQKFSGLFMLDEVGAFIWSRLAAGEDEGRIVAAILEEYEVSRDEAAADVSEFLQKLRDMGVLE